MLKFWNQVIVLKPSAIFDEISFLYVKYMTLPSSKVFFINVHNKPLSKE